ncbi:signal transducer and activator of transcription 5B [Hyalella azteca]|uniref:Signal transducer and activator of transcription n=1 Tax=Hyalella azteca TaxID=294128 RepID=A0A979FUT1_HYAAZ|nr:signal transducer and activator of transcription 5B [Hyalella azteca]
MSLWSRAQQLPPDALREVKASYAHHAFPIEVRHCLALWLEEKMQHWHEMDVENPSHSEFAGGLLLELMREIEAKLHTETDFLLRSRLEEASQQFASRYQQSPLLLVSALRSCFNTELSLVQQHESMMAGARVGGGDVGCPPGGHHHLGGGGGGGGEMVTADIMDQLAALAERTADSANDLRFLEQEQESFFISYHDCTKTNAQLSHLTAQPITPQLQEMIISMEKKKQMGEQELSVKVSGMVQRRLALVEKLQQTLDKIIAAQHRVLDQELTAWKREQQMAGNGRPFNEAKLNRIQEWCEQLADIIWQNRHQVKECERQCSKLPLQPPGGVDMLPALNQTITRQLSSLVTSTFIIEKEPPQVMKTNTRFTATVRLLVGGKLNVHMTPPQVTVSIVSEAQANSLLKNEAKRHQSGEILNNTGTMEYVQSTRQLSVNFRNLQLRKIKRAEKKGTESVMDEKFALLFQSTFSVGGGELGFQANESRCVLNAFHVPDKVPWPAVADMLDTKFKHATGRGLTPDNINFLASKALRTNSMCSDYSSQYLSWSQFCKEPLLERSFTFWEWFFQVMKVTREHLRQLWVDGSILGFVGRRQAEELLSASPPATFLLRFSDSELGGVTIAWSSDDVNAESREVFMLQPFTSKDFGIRPLADRISDLRRLTTLYPNTPKDHAFSKYYTPVTELPPVPGAYIPSGVVTHVLGWPKPGLEGSSSSYPNTPVPLGSPSAPSSVPSAMDHSSSSEQKPSLDSPLYDAANVLANF